MELKFIVNGQLLKLINPTSLVKGSRNYLKCRFTFSEDLKDYRKVAKFTARNVEEYMPIIDELCSIPDNITSFRKFHISVLCMKDTQYIPTNEVTIRQEVTS